MTDGKTDSYHLSEDIENTSQRSQWHPLAAGDVVDGCKIENELGRGGMGVVYLAYEEALDRHVALKVHNPTAQSDIRFLQEVLVQGKFTHPHIIPIFRCGQFKGCSYVIMKYVEGGSLDDRVKDFVGKPDAIVAVLVKIASALNHMHALGIIHRDVKPANVLFDLDGNPFLTDFGTVKYVDGQRGVQTVSGVGPLGTVQYMSPEQVRGVRRLDALVDVYALGAVLYELLTGKRAFDGGSHDNVYKLILKQRPIRPRTLNLCVDSSLETIAFKCLEKNKLLRYQDMNSLCEDFALYQAGKPIKGRDVHPFVRAVMYGRSRPWATMLSVLLAATFVYGVTATVQRIRSERLQKFQEDLAKEKSERTVSGVRDALKQSATLRDQYRFGEAKSLIGLAAELAENDAQHLRATVNQAQSDLDFAAELDDIRYRKWVWVSEVGNRGRFNTAIAPAAYRAAFAARQFDLDAEPLDDIIQRLNSSAIKPQLIAALDDWWLFEKVASLADRLRRIVRIIDPHPWRDRVRDPELWQDAAARSRLVADAFEESESSEMITTLSILMDRHGMNPITIVQRARIQRPSDFELLFKMAQLQEARKERRAIGTYEAAHAIRPGNVAVLNNLGTILTESGFAEEAITHLKQAIQTDPTFPEAFNNMCIALWATKNYADAAEAARNAIKLNPKFSAAYTSLGIVLKNQDHLAEAIDSYKTAIRLDPESSYAHVNLGVALRASGDLQGAIVEYRTAISISPEMPQAHSNLGNALLAARDLKGAVEASKQAVKLDPTNAVVHFNLGAVFSKCGELDSAISSYRQTVQLDPQHALGWCNLGYVLRRTGRHPEAIIASREAIRLNRNDVLPYYNLGNSLGETGDHAGAAAAFRDAIRVDSKFAPAYSALSVALLSSGDMTGALAASEKAVEINPHDGDSQFQRGVVLSSAGQLREAIQAYREATRLDPRNVKAFSNLGNALVKAGEYSEAIAACRQSIKLEPGNPICQINLGAAYEAAKDYDNAILHAQEAIRLDPKFSTAHALLGECFVHKGDRLRAQAAFAEAVRLDSKQWQLRRKELNLLEEAPPPRMLTGPNR